MEIIQHKAVQPKTRIFAASWSSKELNKKQNKLKSYYTGKIRGSRNKVKIRNLVIHRHNKRILAQIQRENELASIMAEEIRKEIDNEIIASILYGKLSYEDDSITVRVQEK